MMTIKHKTRNKKQKKGFTLIETLIAITLLMLAVVEPMSLTAQALKAAYYSRDQVTASNLAQEAVEAVRSVRDAQILTVATNPSASVDIFGPIPVDQDFTIDTTTNAVSLCNGPCPPLQTNGILYAYNAGWTNTGFTRTVHACYVQPVAPFACNSTVSDEMRLQVTVTWRTGSYPARSISIYENLYRWISNT
jgi:prepilin-type N-terminal cleavage/methylation domain-containing protein